MGSPACPPDPALLVTFAGERAVCVRVAAVSGERSGGESLTWLRSHARICLLRHLAFLIALEGLGASSASMALHWEDLCGKLHVFSEASSPPIAADPTHLTYSALFCH